MLLPRSCLLLHAAAAAAGAAAGSPDGGRAAAAAREGMEDFVAADVAVAASPHKALFAFVSSLSAAWRLRKEVGSFPPQAPHAPLCWTSNSSSCAAVAGLHS